MRLFVVRNARGRSPPPLAGALLTDKGDPGRPGAGLCGRLADRCGDLTTCDPLLLLPLLLLSDGLRNGAGEGSRDAAPDDDADAGRSMAPAWDAGADASICRRLAVASIERGAVCKGV